jgi:glucose uptake protein GlcU
MAGLLLSSWCGSAVDGGVGGSACGWGAAIVAVIAWGSFGVPIRDISPSTLDVSPLVLQGYKTLVCFATSFAFVWILGEPLVWSWYGLLSGLFWVPGATAGIYGIRNAGLAVAVGTWSSIIVLTSVFFGIVVFREPVRDVGDAVGAFLILIVGLVGMARYSSPASAETDGPADVAAYVNRRRQSSSSSARAPVTARSIEMPRLLTGGRSERKADLDADVLDFSGQDDIDVEDDRDDESAVMLGTSSARRAQLKGKTPTTIVGPWLLLTRLTARQWGILGAVFNGAWGGMNLIPLHYAKERERLSGASYVVSFAGGALIVNSAMFGLLVLYHVAVDKDSWATAIGRLPKWHVREMGGRGLLAGLLYSVGNFASIVAVTYLGQGTGYSACQMQLLVSGLWGVFYFREIKSTPTIVKWFLSAATALVGVLWLAYERESSKEASHANVD